MVQEQRIKNALGWVIKDSSGIIKMVASRQIGNASIILWNLWL